MRRDDDDDGGPSFFLAQPALDRAFFFPVVSLGGFHFHFHFPLFDAVVL